MGLEEDIGKASKVNMIKKKKGDKDMQGVSYNFKRGRVKVK